MIYTIEKATLITEQLRRLTSGYAHHVAGQFANLDFWLNEVQEAIKTLDQHRSRFDKMRELQKAWVEDHGTVVHDHCPICRGICEFSDGRPSPPQNRYKNEIIETRRELIDSAYYFLVRCYRLGLLNDQTIKQKCDSIGTSIDPNDLEN